MLEVENLTVRFGGLSALILSVCSSAKATSAKSWSEWRGQNNALQCHLAPCSPAAGDIRVQQRSILGLKASQIARVGIARTFQHLGIFPTLTVEENIVVGGLNMYSTPVIPEILGLRTASDKRRELVNRARDIARFCDLECELDKVSGILAFGVQKRIELARALACEPIILLLDEPASGLSHKEAEQFLELAGRIRTAFNLTIIMIEHHLGLVMRASDHVIVFNFGRKIAEGTAASIRRHPEVISAYLGKRS